MGSTGDWNEEEGKNRGKGGAAESMPTVFQLRGRARCSERGRKRFGWITANTQETLGEPLTWAGMESATWRRRTYRKLTHINPHAGCANQEKKTLNAGVMGRLCQKHHNLRLCQKHHNLHELLLYGSFLVGYMMMIYKREFPNPNSAEGKKSPSPCQARPSISVVSHLSSRADVFLHCSTSDRLFG